MPVSVAPVVPVVCIGAGDSCMTTHMMTTITAVDSASLVLVLSLQSQYTVCEMTFTDAYSCLACSLIFYFGTCISVDAAKNKANVRILAPRIGHSVIQR